MHTTACFVTPRADLRATARLLIASLALLGLGACGEPIGNDDLPVFMPSASPILGDAQVEAGAAVNNAPKPDAGSAIDSGTPLTVDAQVVLDAQIVPPDAGDAGAADASTDAKAPDATAPRMDLDKGTGKDVITIGDSWMLLIFTGIQESLVKASGNQPYRKYGFPGTKLLDSAIPNQYRDAKAADPNIKTVVMTGGGNDIIQDAATEADCASGGAMCTARLEAIGKALDDMWKQMSKDGVQDVVHVMYSKSAGKPIKDREANNQKLAEQCANVPPPLRCHLLNTDALIGPGDMRSDGIHPNDAGYDKIGKAVFELMVKEGMRR
jgi:lysophospholipase L1-like esterase